MTDSISNEDWNSLPFQRLRPSIEKMVESIEPVMQDFHSALHAEDDNAQLQDLRANVNFLLHRLLRIYQSILNQSQSGQMPEQRQEQHLSDNMAAEAGMDPHAFDKYNENQLLAKLRSTYASLVEKMSGQPLELQTAFRQNIQDMLVAKWSEFLFDEILNFTSHIEKWVEQRKAIYSAQVMQYKKCARDIANANATEHSQQSSSWDGFRKGKGCSSKRLRKGKDRSSKGSQPY